MDELKPVSKGVSRAAQQDTLSVNSGNSDSRKTLVAIKSPCKAMIAKKRHAALKKQARLQSESDN